MDASSPSVVTGEFFCGLIMPIAETDGCPASHWRDVKTIIKSAVESIPDTKFKVRTVSEGDETGIIHRRIVLNVYEDPIAICDLSARNPNVLFELGMRLAFDKPVVLIKDDETGPIFDVGLIEYLSYPRALRHGPIEQFKRDLAAKVRDTYRAAKENPAAVSFIKHFGPIKTIKLETVSEPADKAMLSMLTAIQHQINRMQSPMAAGNDHERDELVNLSASPSRVQARHAKLVIDEIPSWKAAGHSVRGILDLAEHKFPDLLEFFGQGAFRQIVRNAISTEQIEHR
jgi:hypothetical protein